MIPVGIEYDYHRQPWATAGIMLACGLVFAMQNAVSETAQLAFLLQPNRFAPWQWVTSTFMHADVMHLCGNMLFLFVYGRYMEERLGPWRFLGLYLALGVGASLVYLCTNLGSSTPALGASGAISAIMGAVLVTAPQARVRVIWRWYYSFHVPAVVLLGLWLLTQVAMGLGGAQGIAISAHIGGFALGSMAALAMRQEFARNSGWYLDPGRATPESLAHQKQEQLWKGIAEYHQQTRPHPGQVTPGWQPPKPWRGDTPSDQPMRQQRRAP